MRLDWLFTWWNAVYSLPLAFILLMLTITSVLSLVGGAVGELTQGDAHADVHADADTDIDVDADVDVDADMDLDHNGHVDAVEHAIAVAQGHGHGHGHGHNGHAAGPGPLVSALVALGVGRAPLLMLLQVLILLWGLIGMSLHQTLNVTGPGALLWSLPITFLFSVLGTRAFAGVFGRFFKPYETASLKRHQIVGRSGRVVFPVTAEEGTVHVRDQHGTLHRLRARSEHGVLDSGREIIVVGYDRDQGLYQVDDASAFVDRA